jgi:5-methylcytosine-specific restriction protein A
MMLTPLKPCTYPGCNKLVKSGRCESHRKQADRKYEKDRESDPWRGWIHSARYRQAIAIYKADYPLCKRCLDAGRVTPVYIVHHIVEHKGDWDMFWDQSNWESICNKHHEAIHGPERWKKRG